MPREINTDQSLENYEQAQDEREATADIRAHFSHLQDQLDMDAQAWMKRIDARIVEDASKVIPQRTGLSDREADVFDQAPHEGPEQIIGHPQGLAKLGQAVRHIAFWAKDKLGLVPVASPARQPHTGFNPERARDLANHMRAAQKLPSVDMMRRYDR
jgi:hypothetical protein